MKARKKKRTGQSRADKLRMEQRLDDIVRIRLDGAQWWDVREFVSEKEREQGSCWELKQGGKPLSERHLRNYVRKADAVIIASVKEKRPQAIRRHLARREHMYGAAMNAGDIRTALAVAQD